jgi:hypothetical protein
MAGASPLAGQMYGDTWVMGYKTSTIVDTSFGFAYWRFDGNYPVIEYELDVLGSLSETNASISTNQGEVLVITNGMEIFTPSGERIIDTIAYLDGGENWSYYYWDTRNIPTGFPKIQTAIILPVPDRPDEYSVIYYHAITEPESLFFGVVALLESRIRLLPDQSWEVVYQDRVVLENYEFLSEGTWQACRHANGRDWWILVRDYTGTTCYRLLVDPSGPHLVGTQSIDEDAVFIHFNAWFSPDGSKYVKYAGVTLGQSILYFYDFDRCTGLLSNRTEIYVTGETMILQGMAFSPNSRYLFISADSWEIYQYDLWAQDIEATRMLVDTNDGYVEPGWFNTTFGPMMPGPDGRIYMFPITGSSRAVHVIDRPNERGKSAKLLQHHIMLQTSNGRAVQNLPNFRLGPVDDSSCDTLGLDNHPVARWRYEVEGADPLEIRFTDLSFFEPDLWVWDFGDGALGFDQHPIHQYESPGLYHVCLIVANDYSADSTCQWIGIQTVSMQDVPNDERYNVFPNPFNDYIEIHPENAYQELSVRITGLDGRAVADIEVTCPCRLKLGDVPPGVYFFTIREEEKVVKSGKLVKM